MLIHETKIRVRYGEVDQMGFLYYGNYGLYYEVARAEMIREANYTYREMEEDGIVMPVLKLNIKYLRPAKYDQLIRIETTLQTFTNASFITFQHKLFNEENELINKGEVTLTFFNPQENKRTKMPKKLADFLVPHYPELNNFL